MRSLRLVCGALALSAAFSLAAHATPITITETATASGAFNGSAFSSQLITIIGSGDTASITNPSAGIFDLALTSGTLQIGAAAPVNFTAGLTAFSFANSFIAGLTSSAPPQNIVLGVAAPALGGYDLTSAITASGSPAFNNGLSFATSGGAFDLTSVNAGATFTATLGAATPEPSSVLLLGTGLLGTLAAARRKLRLS